MNELKEILQAVLDIIRKKYYDSIFDLWFKDLYLSDLTDKLAVFRINSDLKKKILSQRYINDISSALTEVIGFEVRVVIESDENKSGDRSPDEKSFSGADLLKSDPEKEDSEKNEEKEELPFIENVSVGEETSSPFSKNSTLSQYTFDNFIVGESNKFAHAACRAVANEPTTYNPLFIYGASGLGKTHLLYAVINEILSKNPSLKIVYIKSEDFTNQLIAAISTVNTQKFRDKFRSADILLIDDIQFIAGKESTQEEFFHTFTALYEDEKQIILTSDRPPKEIKPLEDRLRTRFEWGLIADVQPPSFELRKAIIKNKTQNMGLNISDELTDYMAERLHNNIRQIEGVLKKISAISSLTGESVSKETIDRVISVIAPGSVPRSVLVDRIMNTVAKQFSVTVEDIKSKKKTDTIAAARHVCVYLMRNLTDMNLKEIGGEINRDHTTVMSSLSKVESNINTVSNYEKMIEDLKKKIK